jgi:uncharacterized membrane protein
MQSQTEQAEAAWGFSTRQEPRWPASLAVILAILLYITLPDELVFGSTLKWAFPILEASLLVPLNMWSPMRHQVETPRERFAAIAIIVLVNAANLASLTLLVYFLLHGRKTEGYQLIRAAIEIWLTNVIVFALWYWELDRGGPDERLMSPEERRQPDFLFPQMATPEVAPPNWGPTFVDYLFVSFTNSTAFSPTDTLPLTSWAKLLMMVQALASLLTVALVAARAVNILS